MLAQTSDITHAENGLPVANLGRMVRGGSLGRSNRNGRAPRTRPDLTRFLKSWEPPGRVSTPTTTMAI